MNSEISSFRTLCAFFIAFFLFSLPLLFSSPAAAATVENTGAPKSLEEWIPWVMHDQEGKTCTLRSNDATKRYCTWPSRLNIELSDNGALFTQEWLIETDSLVPLPGSSSLWPERVKDGKTRIAVLDHKGTPSVRLMPGQHVITGILGWNQMPDSITLPAATGLVTLNNKLSGGSMPFMDKQGKLWLKTRDNKVSQELDQATLQVFRKIIDSIPLQEELHMVLTVSGTPREITLGLMVKDDFLPLKITSPLPVRMDEQGRVLVQARPGQWTIDLLVRNTLPKTPAKLTIGTINGLWPENEIWVFEASPKLRRVRIENVRSIDPSRTGLPATWMNLPAYLVGRNDVMGLIEKGRGNPRTIPDRLSLSRTLWLDETGQGLTAHDAISGTMSKGWRLNVVREQQLGQVTVDGKSQLITRLPNSDQVGVELRKGNISLVADSRIDQSVHSMLLTFPAPGWDQTFQQLSARLNLPPGWKLLASSGIDRVPTWLNRWTLLDIFLVLITAIATGKILGARWGVLALFVLALAYHQPQSPRYLWLPLLALFAICGKVTSQKGKIFVQAPLILFLVLLILQSVPFMVREIRIGLFPQLEMGPYFQVASDNELKAQDAVSASIGLRREAKSAPNSFTTNKPYGLQTMAPSPLMGSSERGTEEMQIDPQAVIQTGPGLPNWHWLTIPLTWNGPVGPDQKVRLVLLPPWLNCILAFLRVGLLSLLILVFLRRSSLLLTGDRNSAITSQKHLLGIMTVFLLIPLIPLTSKAEIPSPEMLQELHDRLLAPPVCGEECASIDTCVFAFDGELFSLELTVHASTETAVPLPGGNRTFSAIFVDDKPATGLRSDDGTLLVHLSAGIHHVRMEKDLHDISDFNLIFPLLPHRAQAQPSHWSITGIHPDGTMAKQINVRKIEDHPTTNSKGDRDRETSKELTLPPFFQVIRTLHLGLKWTVDTRVVRKSRGNIITAEVPIISGERPTTEPLYITKNKVQVNLGAQETEFSWHSVLPQNKSLTLSAPTTSDWVEIWYLDISPIWHVVVSGIPEVSQTNSAGLRFPEYRPYPGESMAMTITRPEGIPGPTMTIDSSRLSIQPGLRATDCTLHLNLHASRGTDHIITLPNDVELLKVAINNKEYQLQPSAGKITLPIQPGKQQVEIDWRSKEGLYTKSFSPKVDLGVSSVNASIHMDVPLSRWILLTGGPRIGPAVLFWGELLVIILLSFFLGRIRFIELTTIQWLLLGIGLSQVSVVYGALVVGWLFLLGLRKQKGETLTSPIAFNLLQIVLVAATVLACFSLLYAVQKGLLGYPDMQIGGNGSHGRSLIWYQDRNTPSLPQAWIVSVPLFVYRCLMLAWALWLAFSLMKWLRWGWTCFTTGGIWHKSPLGSETKSDAPDNQEQYPLSQERNLDEDDFPVPDIELTEPSTLTLFQRFRKKVKEKTTRKKD